MTSLPNIGSPDFIHSSDDIFELIAAHATAWAAFGRTVSQTDEVRAEKEGRKITKGDRAAYAKADEAETEALRALLRAPVNGATAMRAKALYVQLWTRYGNTLDDDEYDLLLTSVVNSRGAEVSL